MATSLDSLPPRWRENMLLRRPCLLRFGTDEPMSVRQATELADELSSRDGEGSWDNTVVQLDASGREWEFRFKPHVARVERPRLHTAPSRKVARNQKPS